MKLIDLREKAAPEVYYLLQRTVLALLLLELQVSRKETLNEPY